MECLVDDAVNSNILPSCPTCGLDLSLSFISSVECVTECQNCKRAVIDNNLLIQSHHDCVPPVNISRPRCCSCLDKSTVVLSVESTDTSVGLEIRLSRSSSNPNQLSFRDQSPHLEQISSSTTDSPSLASDFTEVIPSKSITSNPLMQHSEASPDQLSVHIYTSDIPEVNGSNLNPDIVLSDNVSHDINQRPCPNCGGFITLVSNYGQEPDLTSVSSNINTDQTSSYEGDIPSTSPSSLITTPPVFTQSDESSKKIPPRSPKPTQSFLETTDTLPHKPQPAFQHSLHISSVEAAAAAPKEEHLNPHQSVIDSQPLYLTTSQIISHNKELNRITTARTKKITQSTKSSRTTHRDTHLGVASPQPSRHSFNLTSDLPRIVTPDSPLPILPFDLLYELHDLDHENEDLSAEVVYSLHFRDYQIKELLGKGISSTVRRVTEKSTGAEFAVKIIDISGEKGEVSQVEQVKKDTFREIKILRMCAGHPNIIELHDVFETPTFIFLVFEICRKGELFDYLTSVVSLSEKRTRIFMRQLVEAVAYIHDKDIVHRDLKPENILLDDNLNIKVSDFGFATVVGPGEELTELCGTPGYLAPEVLAHSMYENVSGYNKQVDMWACGVIMYTLLCGAPPFWNRRQMMMLRAIMNAEYTFSNPEWDDITDAPKNLIQKLLVVNPKERLTAKEALKHPFFHSQVTEEKKFHARRKFRAAVNCVIFYQRLSFSYKHPPPISVEMIRNNPYSIKIMRKVIDTCAFSMYKHWVKRVDNQNRAALFEHTLRDDWKHTPMIVDGIQL